MFERFWSKVLEAPNGCWLWMASLDTRGYGQFKIGGRSGRLKRAHRLSYRMWIGPIPDWLTIDHTCRNRRCVNPAHLEAVTNRENILRGNGASAANTRKTHCPQGHSYDEANTYVTPGGSRHCRTCDREYHRRTYVPRRTLAITAPPR